MEGPNNYSANRNNGTEGDEPSRTYDHDDYVNRERVSPQILNAQSESGLRNPFQVLDVLEISSDDDRQVTKISKRQSDHGATEHRKESNEPNQMTSGRTSPKDLTCSVCLSEYDNKAFLDKCFHAFCYFCILQWSEIVRTCPLCKSSFTSIIHSVKSMDNYQQHYLTNPDLSASAKQSQNDGRRFRYRTTLTIGSQLRQQTHREQQDVNEFGAWEQRAQRRQAHLLAQRNRGMISQERRRNIYGSNLWVQGVIQEGRPRQRDISREFFRINPACTHRLIPWLTRDLRVLLNEEESHVRFVLQIILSLITKVDLSSEEFCDHVRPFLFDKTEHFIHEFVSFARSPFDMNAYDDRAQYSWPDESHEQVRDTPTVFHSHTAGWQTPVPGPSGVTLLELSQADWNIESSVLQNEITSWSPRSSPGTTALNAPRVQGTVTITSSSSHSVPVEHSDSDALSNGSLLFKGKRREPKTETTTKESTERSTKKKSRRHHRHSHKHKHKHKRKHKSEHSSKRKSRRHSNSLLGESNMPGPSDHVSVDLPLSDNPVEVIVVSDSSNSPVWSRNCSEAARGDLVTKGSASWSRSRSKSKEKNVCKRDYSHWSHSRSRDKGKHRSQSDSGEDSESCSRRDRHSTSERRDKKRSHDRSRSRFSVSQGLATEKRRKSSHDRWRSRSRYSESHSQEARPLKRENRWQRDNRDPLNSESLSAITSNIKKEKRERGRKRWRSRSPVLSHPRSKGKSDLKTQAKNFELTRKSSRSKSPSTERRGATSSSHSSVLFSDSSMSHSFRRHSRDHSPISQAERFTQSFSSRSPPPNQAEASVESRRMSRLRSRSKSRYKVSSASESKESSSCSSEGIKKEIEDLELRINSDKKRLLQLLIKQGRNKPDGVTDISKETCRE